MNILVVAAHGLYADYGASFVHSQAKEYVRAGHRVRAVVPVAIGKRLPGAGRISAPVTRRVQDGVEIYYLRYPSLGHFGENGFNPASAQLTARIFMGALLRGFAPDVIHAHAILFAGRIACDIGAHCGAPVVITTHGGDTDLALTPRENARAARICSAAACVAAVSGVYAKKTRRIGGSAPVVCILNGFNAVNVRPAPKKRRSIIQVCYLTARKHVDVSLAAVARLCRKYDGISFTVVGSGVERAGLEKLAHELGLDGCVEFCGFLPNDETMARMAQSEIFLLPSVDEGFGIAYIEAMASGCVAIGTQGEGISSVITSGENGFLVPPLDADAIAAVIARCFDAPEYASGVAEKGRESAMSLTWERNAAEYIALFEKILNGERIAADGAEL